MPPFGQRFVNIGRYAYDIKLRDFFTVNTEPDLNVFGCTEHQSFPLITIFGREPNNDMETIHAIGRYADGARNGKRWPPVSFWDKSYGLLGRYVGLAASELKMKSIERDSSPIVISDFSPLSLDGRYTSQQKIKIRKTIPVREINEHVNRVLTHDSIFSRTNLVILSGLERCGFHEDAVRHIEDELDNLKTPWCHVTSLSSRTTSHAKRQEELVDFKPIISEVMNEFLNFEIISSKSA